MTFAMFSEDALAKFRTFCEVANMKAPRPQGAFDQAMSKTQPQKEMQMSYRYVPVKGTANSLFTRERSNLAYDEAGRDPNEIANAILQFLSGKISDDDMRQVKEYLMIEAGEDPDNVKEAKQMAKASASRGAQDSRPSSSFAQRFPSAAKIGRDDMIGRR